MVKPLADIPREFYTKKIYPTRSVISCKVGMLPPVCKKTRKPIELRQISTAKVSARRSKIRVNDLLECNTYNYFVTLTFGIQERLNDSVVKNEWNQWRREFRRKFPNGHYVAVPEYHKSGGLHIHMVIGGVTAKELDLQKTDFVCCSWAKRKYKNINAYNKEKKKRILKTTDGLPIYNVGAWTLGFSTCTEILYPNAVYTYISKYITKGAIDPRFCDAKRYWCSKNIRRPVTAKYQGYFTLKYSKLDAHLEKYPCVYACVNNCFYVFDASAFDITKKPPPLRKVADFCGC